uniref:Chromatin remodeling complex atpase n=1 Tax=Dulem virus 37 TaxID=3145755 RepID=A0AAU8AXC5_9CAUD
MKFKPYAYQEYAENFILENEGAGLLLDMGMGKTVTTLTAVDELIRDRFEVRCVLVIAPLKPAAETWPVELMKWEHLEGLTYSLVLGSEKERTAALAVDADIYIINRENVVWLVNYYKKKWPFDMVVIDELSSFKSPKSQRFRALKRVRPMIKRLVGLTGTPSPNGLLDLWSQVYLIDEGEALGKTVTGYREKYFVPDKRNATTIFSWKPKEGAEKEIYERIKPCCISMDSAEYLTLPERLYINHEVELSDEVKVQYKQLERDMLLPFADGDIDAGSAGILTNKLLQLCGGCVYDENRGIKEFHSEKLDKLEQLVEEANGQSVLVFYAYQHERDRIMKKFPEAVEIREKEAVSRWNAGKISILLAHPASAGHGLNLQEGGHIAVWYNWTHNLELYQQANKRLHRPGQKETVLIHHIGVKEGLDMQVLNNVLAEKASAQEFLIQALKAKIKEAVL